MDVNSLLLQFNCLGTTDKDDLIKQMQIIVGWHLPARSAEFFLEMNNWNLQAAVGSYFDARHSQNFPYMALYRNYGTTSDDEIRVHPGTSFSKSWEIENAGDEPWPPGCALVFSGGTLMCAQDKYEIECLPAGCRKTIRLDMIAPSEPGIYDSKWRMATITGSFFGEVMWVIATVADQTLNGLTQQLSSLSSIGAAPNPPDAPCNPFNTARPQSNVPTNLDEDGNMIL